MSGAGGALLLPVNVSPPGKKPKKPPKTYSPNDATGRCGSGGGGV